MNKKKLALEVFKSSELRKIASLKSVDKSALIRMIAEEITEAAPRGDFYVDRKSKAYNAKKGIQRDYNKAAKAQNFDAFLKKYEGGRIEYTHFDEIPPEQQEVLKKFVEFKLNQANKQVEILQAAAEVEKTDDPQDDQQVQQAQQALDQEASAAEEKVDQALADSSAGGEGESGIVNAVSMLNSSIGYAAIAAVLVPGGQAALPVLKALQLPAAVTASILQAAVNGDTAKAVAELVELLPVDRIPGFDKVVSKIAQPIIKRLGEELAQAAVKEVTEKTVKDLIAAGVVGIDKGIKIGEETLSLDSLTELSPAEAAQLLLTKAGDLGVQLLDYLKDNFLSGDADAGDPAVDTPEETLDAPLDDLLQRFADFIKKPGILSEQINYVIKALDIEDTNNFGSTFGKTFKREEIQTLKDHFEDSANGAAFFEKYFAENPEFLERFKQILAGEGEPPPEEKGEEEEAQKTLDDVEDIPESEIAKLREAYDRWSNEFMTVKTLLKQSQVFGQLWNVIKVFAGKGKSDLEQAARAINLATATRGEEEEARTTVNEAEGDELEALDWSDEDWERTPEEEAALDQSWAEYEEYQAQWEETWEEQSGQEAPPEEVKEEFKRNVLERLLVLKRHSKQISEVLGMYKNFAGELTQGDKEALAKYGDPNPRRLLYKLVNLMMNDINDLLGVIESLQPEENKLAETLLEVDGEKFTDKLRKVVAVNEFVVGQGQVLLKMLTAQNTEPEPEQLTEEPEEDTNKQLSSKELSLKIYEQMATIAEYFPNIKPLDSDYQLDKVVKDFAFLITIIQDHIATMVRFKDDKDINPASLKSARQGLLRIKKVLMDLFNVADNGKLDSREEDEGSYNPEGQEEIQQGNLEEPTVVEAEWEDDEEEEQEDQPPEEGKEQILTNRSRIEKHMKWYLPPKVFMEIFKDNEKLNPPDDPTVIENAYDAFTLFWILTKFEEEEAQLNEASEDPFLATSMTSISKINQKLKASKMLTDPDKVESIIYDVLNKYFKQKSKDFGFFITSAEPSELVQLNIRLKKADNMYPFKVQMANVGTLVKTYGGGDAFEPTGEPEESTPVEDEQERKDLESINDWLEEPLQDPEVQQKIQDLPEEGPELVDGMEELTMSLMSTPDWSADLAPVVDLKLDSPEVKQAVADAVEAEVEEKRPEIKMPALPDDAPELEPDMDEPASIDMPESPREIQGTKFKKGVKRLRGKPGILDVGKVKNVLLSILKSRKIKLSEGQFGGHEVTTFNDLKMALIAGGAIVKDPDEDAIHATRLIAELMSELGVEFEAGFQFMDLIKLSKEDATKVIKASPKGIMYAALSGLDYEGNEGDDSNEVSLFQLILGLVSRKQRDDIISHWYDSNSIDATPDEKYTPTEQRKSQQKIAKIATDLIKAGEISLKSKSPERLEEQLTAKLTPIIKKILNRTNNG